MSHPNPMSSEASDASVKVDPIQMNTFLLNELLQQSAKKPGIEAVIAKLKELRDKLQFNLDVYHSTHIVPNEIFIDRLKKINENIEHAEKFLKAYDDAMETFVTVMEVK